MFSKEILRSLTMRTCGVLEPVTHDQVLHSFRLSDGVWPADAPLTSREGPWNERGRRAGGRKRVGISPKGKKRARWRYPTAACYGLSSLCQVNCSCGNRSVADRSIAFNGETAEIRKVDNGDAKVVAFGLIRAPPAAAATAGAGGGKTNGIFSAGRPRVIGGAWSRLRAAAAIARVVVVGGGSVGGLPSTHNALISVGRRFLNRFRHFYGGRAVGAPLEEARSSKFTRTLEALKNQVYV